MDRSELRRTVAQMLVTILGGRAVPELRDETRATDIPGWDSLNHLKLLVALEDKFQIRFGESDLEDPRDLGEFLDQMQAKIGAAAPG